MTPHTARCIEVARRVAAAAKEQGLQPEMAVRFCEVVLPDLLVEIDIAHRVEERLMQSFPVQPEQATCDATICSNRWPQVAAETKKRNAKKKASKKPRKRKETSSGDSA